MSAQVSAPVLVYEKPRFTDAMFAKAKDAPLQMRDKEADSGRKGCEAAGISDSKNVEGSTIRQPNFLRRLSIRSRSSSAGRDLKPGENAGGGHRASWKSSRTLQSSSSHSGTESDAHLKNEGASTASRDGLVFYVDKEVPD